MARVAIVTGGTRGIGEAISIALKDMGMQVAANYAGNDERARDSPTAPASPPTNGTSPIMKPARKASPRSKPTSARSTCWSTMPASPATRR